jgi:hypothetical protein
MACRFSENVCGTVYMFIPFSGVQEIFCDFTFHFVMKTFSLGAVQYYILFFQADNFCM